RYRDTGTEAGRAETLALDQDLEDPPLVQVDDMGGAARQFLQRLLLAGDAQMGDHAVGGYELGDIHPECPNLGSLGRGLWLPTIEIGIDPADMAVPSSVNDIYAAMCPVAENKTGHVGE